MFSLKQIPTVIVSALAIHLLLILYVSQSGLLGMKIDLAEIDKAVEKIKKQINLECNMLPLIDEDLLRVRREYEQELIEANERMSLEVREEILKTDLRMETELKEISGVYKDEVTLLSRISMHCY